MKRLIAAMLLIVVFCVLIGMAPAQSQQGAPASNVISKSVQAISYQVGGGSTRVNLRGTSLMQQAGGEAKVEARKGITNIRVDIQGLAQPSKLGTEFLTYVLWVVSPEGRTSNIGEILVNDAGAGKLETTTQWQVFSLIVTAEPYFAVRQPSEMVVLENEFRKDTKGKLFVVNDYRLMKRDQYQKMGNPLALSPDLKNVPLEMYEARNAVEIAKSRGAVTYAQEIFAKAESSLEMAENALSKKANKKEIISTARQTVQFAEDARTLASQRQEEERIAKEREAAASMAKAEAEAKAAAEAAEAKRKADAQATETKRQAEEEARRQAELAAAREAQLKAAAAADALKAKAEAEAAAATAKAEVDAAVVKAKAEADAAAAKAKAEADAAAAKAKAEADAAAATAKAEADAAAAKAKAEADALKAQEEAAKAEAEQARKAAEALRAQLLDQLNRILETRDTPRGLVVNMADVLFDIGKYNLRQTAREKLARLSGIVLAHPGLNLEVEGHTDSTGSDELNQKLSEQRAQTVRSYLVEQGLPEANLTSKGFGKTMPVADNNTAEGRQKNRRVEIIVSGEIIGVKIGK